MDLVELMSILREHIKDAIFPAVAPLRRFDKDKAHEVLSLLLDPWHCKGEVIMTMATDPAAGKSLFKRYTEEILIPTAVNLKKHLSAIEAGGDPDAHDGDKHAPPARATALSEVDDDENAPLHQLMTTARTLRLK